MSGCSPGLGGFPPFLGPSASATTFSNAENKIDSMDHPSFPSLSATVQYRMLFIDSHFIYYILFISHNIIKYKSWKRRIHFGTLVSKCFKRVVKFWTPTFLKWNLRQNISKSHRLPRASQLPCLWSFSKMYGQFFHVFSRHWKFMSKPWLQKQNGKRYMYIYILYIHRNLEIHPGDTYPSKAAIFFAPGSAPELTELLDPPGKGDRGRSENRYQNVSV